MKIQPYIEKLNSSAEFKDFQKSFKNAYLIAGFFVLDLETKQNVHQIDYYVPSEKRIAAFSLDGRVKMQMLNTLNKKVPEKLDIETKVDLDALKGILQDEMKNRSITEEIKKIIAVVQNLDGKKVWILNCILSGMEILKAHVDDDSKTVLKMEKVSIMDIMRKVPASAFQKVPPLGALPGALPIQKGKGVEKPAKENFEQELEQLNKLDEEIHKEKEEIIKEIDKGSKGKKKAKAESEEKSVKKEKVKGELLS